MTYDKRIITHKWGNNPSNDEYTDTNGFIISNGTYDKSFAFYKKLAEQAKKDFPFLKDEDIECFVITRSTYNKGFGGIRFSLPENQEKQGYRYSNRVDFDWN